MSKQEPESPAPIHDRRHRKSLSPISQPLRLALTVGLFKNRLPKNPRSAEMKFSGSRDQPFDDHSTESMLLPDSGRGEPKMAPKKKRPGSRNERKQDRSDIDC